MTTRRRIHALLIYTFRIVKKFAAVALLLAVFAPDARPDVRDETAEFTFARVQFNMTFEAIFDREAPWHHDYPYAEDLYLGLVEEYTGVHTSPEAYQIVQLDSEDIFRFPFLYFSEPGFMDLTDAEESNLRAYFERGGFAMFDDFRGADLDHLRLQMKKLFPNREMFPLEIRDSMFSSFFDIESLEMDPPYTDNRFSGYPEFWSMRDEHGRLIMIANQNNDLGEFWEGLDRGEVSLESSAKAVRLGVNYLIYAMTH